MISCDIQSWVKANEKFMQYYEDNYPVTFAGGVPTSFYLKEEYKRIFDELDLPISDKFYDCYESLLAVVLADEDLAAYDIDLSYRKTFFESLSEEFKQFFSFDVTTILALVLLFILIISFIN